MEPESVRKGISLFASIIKKAFSFINILKAEEKIIDDAAEEILNYLDTNQTASFLGWLDAFKFDSFVNFRIGDLETATERLTKILDEELKYLDVSNENRKKCRQIIVEALFKIGKKEKPLEYIANAVDRILANQSKILEATQQENLSYDTFFTLDASWRAKTRNPNIGIGFFSIDNLKEKDKIQNEIGLNNSFYVSYYCREEAIAMLASSIIKKWPGKRVYVVNDFKTWQFFQNQDIFDSVFLCNFEIQDLQIVDDIPGNSCVYFVGKNERGQSNKDTFTISRRTQKRFEELLKEAGCSVERQVRLTKQTNGLFYPFKAAIWDGAISMYNGLDAYYDCIRLLICFPSFKESDLDYLSSLLPDFKDKVKALSRGENPLVIYPKSSWDTRIHVSDFFAAWAKFRNLFGDNGEYLFSHSDCLMMTGVSKELKKSYLSSLTYYACYFDNTSQRQVDGLISKLLEESGVYNVDGFSELDLYLFAEASPKSVLGYIKKNKDQFISVFGKEKSDGLRFSSSTKIMLALETITTYPEYASEAYRIAAYFAAHESLGDNPVHPTATDLISYLFIPWFNYSGLSPEDRIRLGKSLFKEYGSRIRKGIVLALVTSSGPGISIGLEIRVPNDSFEVTTEDYLELRDAFTEILIDNGSIEEMSDLMTRFSTIRPKEDLLKKTSDRLLAELPASTDKTKFYVSLKLRWLIHDSRFFNRPYFSDKKDYLQFLTDLVENLSFSDNRYLYLHIFSYSTFDYPLLDPIPYHEDHDDANVGRIDDSINAILEMVLDPSFDLDDFLKFITNEGKADWVSNVFARYRHFDEYEPRIVGALCNNGFPDAAYFYIKNRSRFSGELIVNALKDSYNSQLRAMILRSMSLTLDTLRLVNEQNVATQEEFWKRALLAQKVNSSDIFEEVIRSLKRFDLAGPYVEFVVGNESLIGANQVIHLLSSDIDFSRRGFLEESSSALHFLGRVLERFAFENGENQIDNLWTGAKLELAFRTDLEEHLYCLEKFCSYTPTFYTGLLMNVYGDENVANNKDASGDYVLLGFGLHFCPGLIDGVLNERIFNNWVDSYLARLDGKLDKNIIYDYLGRLLGYSMKLDDESPLPKAVCEYIGSHPNDDLQMGLFLSLSAPKGVFSHEITDGSNLRSLADSYHDASIRLAKRGYSEASNVFDKVASSLYKQADKEWEDAVNGGR